MLIRRIARPLLSVAFIGQGVDALRNPKPAADAARPALDGMRKLPDPIGANVPSNAETFARANAAVQIGGGLLLATGKTAAAWPLRRWRSPSFPAASAATCSGTRPTRNARPRSGARS